jgi:hypothetical protein
MNEEKLKDFQIRLAKRGWVKHSNFSGGWCVEKEQPDSASRKWRVWVREGVVSVDNTYDEDLYMCWPRSCSLCEVVLRMFARRYDVPDIVACLPIVRNVRAVHPSVLALRTGVYGRLP